MRITSGTIFPRSESYLLSLIVVSVLFFSISCAPAAGLSAADYQTSPASSSETLILTSAAPISSTVASNVRIYLVTDRQTIESGNSFTVSAMIDTDMPIRGVEWKLGFDPQVMQLQSVDEGSFLKDWATANNGTTMVFPQPVIDNTEGTVSDMAIVIMSSAPSGATGSGLLCTYRFIALNDVIEIPVILDMLLYDTAGKSFLYMKE
jgi:hypothetical protein